MFNLQKSDNQVCDRFNLLYPNECPIQTLEELIEVVRYDHSGFKHKNNTRNNANFISTNVLIADVDNSSTDFEASWYDAEKLSFVFKGFEVYLTPSKNHNIDKAVIKSVVLTHNGQPILDENGKKKTTKTSIIQPKRPKYHLYFPLSKTFTDREEIETLYKEVLKQYPFLDGALKDPARYIDGNDNNPFREEAFYYDGANIDQLIDWERKPIEKSKWSVPDNYVAIEQGTSGRNNVIISKLAQLRTIGWTKNMIREYAQELNQTFVPPIENSELARCIKYVVDEIDGDVQPDEVLNEMQKKYSHITVGGQSFIIEDGDILNYKKYETVRTELKHLRYEIYIGRKKTERECFTDWMESPKTIKYHGLVFDDKYIEERNYFGLSKYNQWRGWAVEPDGTGDCSQFYDLLLRIICKNRQDEYEYILNWLADIIQNPTYKHKHASCIALRGEKGIGKGTVYDCLKLLFNKENALQTAKRDDLFGRFNGALLGKVFVFGDEITWPGDHEVEGVFKDLITNPELRVEEKYAKTFSSKNACRFMLSTNADWAVPVTNGERRFVVFEPSDEEVGNINYFKNVEKQMMDGGASKLLFDLLARDISKVDWTKQPKNEAYVTQKKRGMSSVERFVSDSVESIRNKNILFGQQFQTKYEMTKELPHYSIYQFFNRIDNGFISFTREELSSAYSLYISKYGTQKEKNYPLSQENLNIQFKKIIYGKGTWKGIKKMYKGVDYYHIGIMQLVRVWKKYLVS